MTDDIVVDILREWAQWLAFTSCVFGTRYSTPSEAIKVGVMKFIHPCSCASADGRAGCVPSADAAMHAVADLREKRA